MVVTLVVAHEMDLEWEAILDLDPEIVQLQVVLGVLPTGVGRDNEHSGSYPLGRICKATLILDASF